MFLFLLSLLSLFSSFFSVLFASFSSYSSSCPCSCLLHLFFPLSISLTSSFSASLASSSFSAFFSSASLSRFPSVSFSFCFFLCCLLFRFGCFSSSSWLSSPSSPPSFRSSSSSVSPLLHAYSSFSVSASRWFSSAHPLVCLSCSVV